MRMWVLCSVERGVQWGESGVSCRLERSVAVDGGRGFVGTGCVDCDYGVNDWMVMRRKLV